MTSNQTILDLTPSNVISAIEEGAKDRHDLAPLFGLEASVTAMKPLVSLLKDLEKTDVVRVAEISSRTGPKFEMFTPKTLLEHRRYRSMVAAEEANVDRVRLTLALGDAYLLRDALDTLSRMGLGQVEKMVELVRWRAFGPDSVVTADQLDTIEDLAKTFKTTLLGFSSGASYGIFSPKVPGLFKQSWSFYRHIRHRLAWDQTPTGGMGVHFDEPMDYGEKSVKALVTSDIVTPLVGEKKGVLRMEFDASELNTLIKALEIQANLVMGSFSPVVDLLLQEKLPAQEGHPGLEQKASAALEIAERMRVVLDSRYFEDESIVAEAGRLQSMAIMLRSFLDGGSVHDVEVVGANGMTVIVNSTSALGFNEIELPSGCHVIGYAGEYGVLAPHDGKAQRLVIARSQSLQTAILMAKNKLAGASVRDMGF